MKIFEEKGYTYKEHINTGGEGEIHLIKSVDKLFVAKILPRMDENTFVLLSNLKELNIPNIPKIHDLFNHDGRTIIIRDYIEGETLHEYMQRKGSLDYIEAKSIILKICITLKELHNLEPNPIIYRDLKPENIIITPHKEIRVIDFGIARYYKSENTRDTVLAGTKGYTAPEVLAGMQSDNRSDIYSVGLLFYELLTGKNLLEPPFQVRPVKESNSGLEKWLDVVIAKATDFNQTNRYSNIEEFVYYIEHPHKIHNKKRRKILVIAACAVLAAAAIIYAVSLVSITTYYDIADAEEPFVEFSSTDTDDTGENLQTQNDDNPNGNSPLDTKTDDQTLPGKGETPVFSDKYSVLLNLTFDDISDQNYIFSLLDGSNQFSFMNGKLFVEKEICGVDFSFEKGMTVLYKVRSSELSTVNLGPYNVMPDGEMDIFYYNEQAQTDFGAISLPMEGGKTNAESDYVIVLLHVPKKGDAIYASIINGIQSTFHHLSYRVPTYLNDLLLLDMANVQYTDDGFLHVESITVIEGSPLEYIKNNFQKTYDINKDAIDEFYLSDPLSLPALELEEVPESWYEQ